MGADLLLMYFPEFSLNDERTGALHGLINLLEPDDVAGYLGLRYPDPEEELTPDDWRDELHELVDSFASVVRGRQVASLDNTRWPYSILVAGGMTWGDDPSEAWTVFQYLGNISRIWDQCAKWAEEERAGVPVSFVCHCGRCWSIRRSTE